MGRVSWNDDWILEHYTEFGSFAELADGYSKAFNVSVCKSTMNTHVYAKKLAVTYKKDGVTKEELEYIRKYYPERGSSLLADFNKKFGRNRGPLYLVQIAHKYGIKVKAETRSTIVSKSKSVPLGTVYKNPANNRYYVKASTEKTSSANWIEAGRYTWEQHYGPIPKGKIVIFLDNNPENYADINNLKVVSQRQARQLMAADFRSENPDVTKAGLLLFELRDALGITPDEFRAMARKYDKMFTGALAELNEM